MVHEISDTLLNLEKLRVSLMREQIQQTWEEEKPNTFHQQFYQPLLVNDYPVFQFRYEGSMPLYDESDSDYISIVRDYYYQVTLSMYEFPTIDIQFEKAIIVIQHIFPNGIIRDLDNRNRKYLIDAIRHTGIIKDDNFKHLSMFEEGILALDRTPYVNVFVLESENFKNFMEYKNEFALRDKTDFDGVIKWEELKEKYEKEALKKKENEKKIAEQTKYLFG